MIRVCTINDKEILEKYLQEEPYAGAILAAIEEFGFDEQYILIRKNEILTPRESKKQKRR
jgi:hypothetical protein